MIESFMNISAAEDLSANESFINYLNGETRITACSELEGETECTLTIECGSVAELEAITKELKENHGITDVNHNIIIKA